MLMGTITIFFKDITLQIIQGAAQAWRELRIPCLGQVAAKMKPQ